MIEDVSATLNELVAQAEAEKTTDQSTPSAGRHELLRHGSLESRWELRENDGPIYRELVLNWQRSE